MDDKKERTAFGAGTPQTEENIENSTANNIAENSGKIKVVFQRPGELSRAVWMIGHMNETVVRV